MFIETQNTILQPEIQNVRPDFFEPTPVSPKKVLFADNTGNIRLSIQDIYKPIIKRRFGYNKDIYLPSILGKRKLVDAFGLEIYNDKERYGQEIPPDFFKTNTFK